MTFPSKVFWVVTLLVLCAVSLIAVGATIVVRRTMQQVEEEQSDTLAAQFRQEFRQRGEEVVVRIRGIADSESTLRMAIDLMSANADPSLYTNDAHVLALSQRLDFLDLVSSDGKIISSAEWPVHANSSMDWVIQSKDWAARGAFLARIDTEAGPDLALLAISNAVPVADKRVYVVGGVRMGQSFLRSIILPSDSRAMLYRNVGPGFSAANLIDSNGAVLDADRYASAISQEVQEPGQRALRLNWTADGEKWRFWNRDEKSRYVELLPLKGRNNDLAGVFMIEQPEGRMVAAAHFIMLLGLEAALLAILFGWLARSWATARMSNPLAALSEGAQEITGGNFGTRVDVKSRDELGKLGREFNEMAGRLKEQQELAAQAERVSAWRELAGSFANEIAPSIKQFHNTANELRGWASEGSQSYQQGIRDFAKVLDSQVERLRGTVNSFADFAKTTIPRLIAVDLNGIVNRVMRANEAKLTAVGRPAIVPELRLERKLELIHGDPVLLEKAIENLMASVMEAMPAGGPLVVKTRNTEHGVCVEVSNHGAGISSEEWRCFSPNATASMCSSNGYFDPLALATVQAVVSDHHGTLLIEDEPGVGTRYRIELPEDQPAQKRKGDASVAGAAGTDAARDSGGAIDSTNGKSAAGGMAAKAPDGAPANNGVSGGRVAAETGSNGASADPGAAPATPTAEAEKRDAGRARTDQESTDRSAPPKRPERFLNYPN